MFNAINYPREKEVYVLGKNLFTNDLSLLEVLKMAIYKVPFNGDNNYVPVLWTMYVEFVGAILLFTFLVLTHKLNKKWLFFLIIMLILFFIDKNYMLLFFAGSIITKYEVTIKNTIKSLWLKITILLLGLYFAGIPNIQDIAKQHNWYAYTCSFSNIIYIHFHVIACVFIFVFMITSINFQKIISNKIFVFFGKLSFSLYLLHLPILFILGTYVLNKSDAKINLFILFLICFVSCMLFAILFNKFIDSKAVSLSNKIATKIIKYVSN